MIRYRFLFLNGVLLLALLGARWGTYAESAAIQKTNRLEKDFLQSLSLPFQGWKSSDAQLSANELDLLQPDATLVRRYVSPEGEMAELAVIAGHQKRSVHTPAYCMPGGGWEVLSQEPYELPLKGRTVPAIRSLMWNNEGFGLVMIYFFTDGEYATRNLVRFQGEQLLKRFRGEVPLGALVRVSFYVGSDPARVEQIATQFAQTTVPPVLERIRETRIKSQG